MPEPLEIRVRRVPGPPVVAVRVWLRGGAREETQGDGAPGLALLTGRALTEGSDRRDRRQITADAEAVGAELVGGASLETHGLRIDSLARHWRRALDWAAELVFEPSFPEDRCRRLARRQRDELTALRERPEVRTAHAFLHQLYAPHPAAWPLQGDPEAFAERLWEGAGGAAGLCTAFHRRSLGRGLCMSVAGVIDEETVLRYARRRFASRLDGVEGWGPVAPPEPSREPERRRTVALPPGEQTHLYLGRLTIPRDHPDRTALELLAVVLGWGGGLAGRMPERLRQREALAYAVEVRTLAGAGVDPGRLVVYAATAPEHAERAERAIREELARAARDGVEPRELEEARAHLLGREAFRFETAGQWAEALGDAALYGRPEDDPAWHRERLTTATLEEVNAAARRYLDPEGEPELVVTRGVPGES
jgi:zinc protease